MTVTFQSTQGPWTSRNKMKPLQLHWKFLNRRTCQAYLLLYNDTGSEYRAYSTAGATVNVARLEAKWQGKWAKREGIEPEYMNVIDPPLEPLYSKHLQIPTVLDVLKWCRNMKSGAAPLRNTRETVLDKILEISASANIIKPPANMDLKAYIHRYGADVIRTHVVFTEQDYPSLREDGISAVQQWFESIWKAILLAHGSYSSKAEVILSSDDSLLDRLIDEAADGIKDMVHIPPHIPDILDADMDEDACGLWLATQEALLSMTYPLTEQ
jgi:hypothetical protein